MIFSEVTAAYFDFRSCCQHDTNDDVQKMGLLFGTRLPVDTCFFFFFFSFWEAVEQPSTFRYMHAQLKWPTILTFWLLHRELIGASQKSSRSIGESAIYQRRRRRLASSNVRRELKLALASASHAGFVVPGSLKTLLVQDVDHVVTVNC